MLPKRLLMVILLGALAAADAWSQQADRIHHVGIAPMRGAQPQSSSGSSNPNNIPYNGGPILPNTTTYAFFWGPPADFPPDAFTALPEFLQGLEGTPYLALANEYMLGQTAHTHYGGAIFDSSPPPAQDPSVAEVTDEVANVLAQKGMTPDPSALYVVYTSNFPNENYYCAAHNLGPAPDGTLIHIIYVPNSATVLGCQTNSDPLYTPNKYSEATRAMANSTAHEFMESITDPDGTSWANYATGNEVGDPCNFVFQTPVQLTTGKWKPQQIWSNQAGTCVQGAGHDARVVGAVSIAGSISAFEIPAAAQGVFPMSMNLLGASTGVYTDANIVDHAFLRGPLGNVIDIDVPGSTATSAYSINAWGAVAGVYNDASFVSHGFVRDTKGDLTFFDVPGILLSPAFLPFPGSAPTVINVAGTVAGSFTDVNGVTHGFLRNSLGNLTAFDASGAANGTLVAGINASGAIAGNFLDANFINHGFLRHADGTMLAFDAPGATQGTFAQSINNAGAVAGYYTDSHFVSHGFIRDAEGNFTTFDAPGSATGGTFALCINAAGAVAGYYSDKAGLPRGFIRTRAGAFQTLTDDDPNYGNVVRSLNDLGMTAGYVTRAMN